MSSSSKMHQDSPLPVKKRHIKRLRNFAVFFVLALTCLLCDIFSKQYFVQAFAAGEVSKESFLGVFQFSLVHNSGAAWGIFGDSTAILALLSLVVSVLILSYFIYISKRANLGETMGLAFIIAGGIGNAIDRITLGYVVDFIEFSFIDFPVFNIADICVTCGFAILLLGIFYSWFRETASRKKLKKPIDSTEAH